MDLKTLFSMKSKDFEKAIKEYLTDVAVSLEDKMLCLEKALCLKDIAFKHCLHFNLDSLLKVFPWVYSLTWLQYTPVYNDGDPCTFTFYLWKINDFCVDDFPDEDRKNGEGQKEATLTFSFWNKELEGEEDIQINYNTWRKAESAFSSCLEKFDRELFQTNFGDNKLVTFQKLDTVPESETGFFEKEYCPRY